MRDERFGSEMKKVDEAVLTGPGETPPELRQRASLGEGDGPLGEYVKTVRAHAYRVTDEQVAALRASGLSEDALFEITCAAALGAARARLSAGLRAIRAASEPDRETRGTLAARQD